MSNILIGLLILFLAAGLLFMVFRPLSRPDRVVDADQDGEPDESPEEKRRALEADGD
ncbi:MAG: hypothetical protein JWR59_1962 [Brevundimonas sp.]|nr:hypothetical protein [Brevundimonas sp.]